MNSVARPLEMDGNAMAEALDLDNRKYDASEVPTRRQSASRISLLLAALGGPRQWSGKVTRFVRTLALYFNRAEIRRRLERLQSMGFMETIPNGWQLAFGGLDMVRYFIEPGARDYYQTRGISFGFHQVLRFLDDPVSIIDPVGVMSDRDTIIGHILQVTHANPLYDLQLLEMFEDGMDEMERQAQQMVDGTHPRAISIGAIIEDAEYHQRLLAYIKRYRKDPLTDQMRRKAGESRNSREFVLAEEMYGNLPGFMRYASRLPGTLPALVRHFRNNRSINPEYCDPDVVEAVDKAFAA